MQGASRDESEVENNREHQESEENRVADLKKCLQYALNVQVMKVNTDRCKDMIKAMQNKVEVNKAFFGAVKYYKDKYNMKPLCINSKNLQYWMKFKSHTDNPRFIESLLLQRQATSLELSTDIQANNNIVPLQLSEFMPKSLNKLFVVRLNFKGLKSDSGGSNYREFKLQLAQFQHQNFQKLKDDPFLHRAFTIKEKYVDLLKFLENEFYESSTLFPQLRNVILHIDCEENPSHPPSSEDTIKTIKLSEHFHETALMLM